MKEKTALMQYIDWLNSDEVFIRVSRHDGEKFEAMEKELLDLEKRQHEQTYQAGDKIYFNNKSFEQYFTDTYETK